MVQVIGTLKRMAYRWAVDPVEENGADVLPLEQRFRVLKAYYDSETLYERIRYGLQQDGATQEQIDNLRSPAFRAVEFHVGHVMPGTLPEALKIKSECHGHTHPSPLSGSRNARCFS